MDNQKIATPMVKKNNLSWLWIIPASALAAGLYIAYSKISNLGSEIEITFKTAEGLEAGKTKIRYRSLDIGTVNSIELTDDFQEVKVKAQITKNAQNLLTENAQFWVVKPQIGISGISGFNTLLSGSYIAIAPKFNKDAKPANKFVALNEPPLVPAGIPGLRVKMITKENKGLHYGSPVYYRGFRVGRIDRIAFDDKFQNIEVEAFIREPYDKLINRNTKFWNVSGFDLKIGSTGAEFNMTSPETVVLGGISFSTPSAIIDAKKVDEKTVFYLYENEDEWYKKPNYKKQYFVLYFEDSIRGLEVGAAVEFNGIDIGRVSDITLMYDEQEKKALIPVLIELEAELIRRIGKENNQNDDKTNDEEDRIFIDLIKGGMQANLEQANLISGAKYIKLAVYEQDGEKTIEEDKYSKYQIMPTRNTGIGKITDDIAAITSTIKNLPFESLFNSAEHTMQSLEKSLSTKEIEEIGKSITKSLKQVDQALNSINSVGKNADVMLKNLNKQISDISAQMQRSIKGVNPESNLYYTLNETMRSLQKMSESVNRLMQQLDAKPNSLIMGK